MLFLRRVTALAGSRGLGGRLPLGHDGVADRRGRRGFRRAERFHFLAFDLLLRRAIAEANLVLLGFEPQDLEVIFLRRCEHRADTRAAGLLVPFAIAVALALGAPFLDFGDVAEAFDALGEFDECAEVGGARNFSSHHVADLVRAEPIRPDVLHLLDAERKAAIFGVYLQHAGLHRFALLEFLAGMLDALGPAHIADVDQALHALLDFDERAKIGEVADLAGHQRADRIFFRGRFPGIRQRLLQSERDAALVRPHLDHRHFHLFANLHDLRGMLHALRPAHLADVNQAFDAGLDLHKRAVVRDAHHFTLHARADREALRDGGPRVRQKLLAAQGNALLFLIEFQNLNLNFLARLHH